MRKIITLTLLGISLVALAQDQKKGQRPPTVRSLLLAQLKATHTNKDWFVPANIACKD